MIAISKMKVTLFVLLSFLFNCFDSFSQTIIDEKENNDGCDNRYVRVGCADFYYSKFSRIELISIHPKCDSIYHSKTGELTFQYIPESIISNDSNHLDFMRINERYILSDSLKIRSVMEMLYKNQQNEHEETMCFFEPRNGIIFYDENGKFSGYLEICFQCNQFKTFGDAPNMEKYCNKMILNLKNLFLSNGIQYGITN
jgi:hypothetical protein